MEAEQQNGVPLSLTVPLMHDETHQQPSTVEASNGDQNTTGTTSFFKTCFNGLNALSGSVLPPANSCSEDFISNFKLYFSITEELDHSFSLSLTGFQVLAYWQFHMHYH